MIHGLLALLALQLLGEALARGLGLPVPGPVLGLMLLCLWLLRTGTVPAWLAEAANGLLHHLSLLFVPAAAGLVLHLDRLRSEGLALSVALIASTSLGLLTCAWVMQALMSDEPDQEVRA